MSGNQQSIKALTHSCLFLLIHFSCAAEPNQVAYPNINPDVQLQNTLYGLSIQQYPFQTGND